MFRRKEMSFTSDVTNATVQNETVDGNQNVNNGGVTIGNTVVSGGSVSVNNGGTVIDTLVEAGGKMQISSGGVVSGLYAEMPSSAHISLDGGTIYNLTYNGLPGQASFMAVTGGVIDGGLITGGCIQVGDWAKGDASAVLKNFTIGVAPGQVTDTSVVRWWYGSAENLTVDGGNLWLGMNGQDETTYCDIVTLKSGTLRVDGVIGTVNMTGGLLSFLGTIDVLNQSGGSLVTYVSTTEDKRWTIGEYNMTGGTGTLQYSHVDTMTVTDSASLNVYWTMVDNLNVADGGVVYTRGIYGDGQLSGYIGSAVVGSGGQLKDFGGGIVIENLEILDGGVVDYRLGYQNKINNLYVHSGGSMTAYNMEYGKVTVDGGYFRFGDGRTTWGHVGYADEITVLSGTFYYNPKFFTGHWGGGNATSVGHGRPIGKLTIYDGTTWTLTTMSMRNEKINNALGGTEEFYYVIDGVEHQISTDVNSDLDLTYLPVNEGSYLYLDDGSGRITKNVTINGGVLCMYTSGAVLDNVNLTGMNGFLQAGEGVTYNVVITDGAKYEAYGNNVVTGVVVDGGGKRYEEADGAWVQVDAVAGDTRDGAELILFNNGTGNDVTVINGGSAHVYNGAKLDGASVESGGVLYLTNWDMNVGGGSVYNVNVFSGGTIWSVDSNVIDGLTLEDGAHFVFDVRTSIANGRWGDGASFSNVVDESGKATLTGMRIGSGSVLNGKGEQDDTVMTGVKLSSGGVLNSFSAVTSQVSGTSDWNGSSVNFTIGNNLVENFTVAADAVLWVDDATTLTNVSIMAGGGLHNFSTSTKFNNVKYIGADGVETVMSCGNGSASDIIMDAGSFTVSGVASNITVNGGSLTLSSGSVSGLAVKDGVYMDISNAVVVSGGVNTDESPDSVYRNFSIVDGAVSGVKLSGGGVLRVTDGSVNNVYIGNGLLEIGSDVTGSNLTVGADGVLKVTGTGVNITDAVFADGFAVDLVVSSDMTITGTVTGKGGEESFTISGGAVTDMALNGNVTLTAGTSAVNSTINGDLVIESGARVSNVKVTGSVKVASGAEISDLYIENGKLDLTEYADGCKFKNIIVKNSALPTKLISNYEFDGLALLSKNVPYGTADSPEAYNGEQYNFANTGTIKNLYVSDNGSGGVVLTFGNWGQTAHVTVDGFEFTASRDGVSANWAQVYYGTTMSNGVLRYNSALEVMHDTVLSKVELFDSSVIYVYDNYTGLSQDITLHDSSIYKMYGAGTIDNITFYDDSSIIFDGSGVMNNAVFDRGSRDTIALAFNSGTINNLSVTNGIINWGVAGEADGRSRVLTGEVYLKGVSFNDLAGTVDIDGSEITSLTLAGDTTMSIAVNSGRNIVLTVSGTGNIISEGHIISSNQLIIDASSNWFLTGAMISGYKNTTLTGSGSSEKLNIASRQGDYNLISDGFSSFSLDFEIDGVDTGKRITRSGLLELDGYRYVWTVADKNLTMEVRAIASENLDFGWKSDWATSYNPRYVNSFKGSGEVYLGNKLETEVGGYIFNDGQGTQSTAVLVDGAVDASIYGSWSSDKELSTSWIKVLGGENLSIYGAGSSALSDGTNIWIVAGTTEFVYGGGSGAVSVGATNENAVNLEISGGSHNYVMGGGLEASVITGDIVMNLTGGDYAKSIAGGGQSDITGDVKTTLSLDSVNYANVYGGSINGDITGNVSLHIAGGEYRGLIIGGNRSDVSGGVSRVSGDISLTITGSVKQVRSEQLSGYDSSWVVGGGFAVKGGSVSGQNVSITISGGATVGQVIGGAAASGSGSVASAGNVEITISGGVVTDSVYGGGYSYDGGDNMVSSSVVVIDATSLQTTVMGNIYGGGLNLRQSGSSICETGLVIFKGSGDNLLFTGRVDGTGIKGDSTIEFSDYTGVFNGTISGMDRVVFSGETSVTLSNGYLGCDTIVFDLNGRSSADMFVTGELWFGAGSGENIGFNFDESSYSDGFSFELMEISDGVSLEDVKVSLFDADGIMFAEFAYGTAYDLESGQFELKLDGNILTASYTRF